MKCLCYCVVCCSLMGNLSAFDGNGYLGFCKTYLRLQESVELATYENGQEEGGCLGYLRGVIETAQIWQQGTGRQTFCLPEAGGINQLIRVTIKYIEDNPAELHKNASILVQFALKEAFPCIGR